jgi:hypothetical protein
MDFPYSLYDALLSIDVPNDKARAVVVAMERDMTTHLATKSDLESLRLATKSDIELSRKDMESAIAGLRKDMESAIGSLRKDMEAGNALLRKDMDALGSRVVIQLGALIVVVAGLLLGYLELA